MAQVPIQTTPTQELQPGGINTFNAPGVEPMQNFAGKQIAELGRAQLNFGVAAIKIGDRIQGEIDDVKTTERINALSTQLDEIATEYSTLNGAVAFNARDQYKARIEQVIKNMPGDFDNDVQKMMYVAKASALQRTATSAIDKHGVREFSKYDTMERKASVLNMTGAMAKSWDSRGLIDPNGNPTGDYALYEAAANKNLIEYANKEGIPQFDLSGNETQAFKALRREMIYEPAAVSVTQSMMQAGNYSAAKKFLDEEFEKGNIDAKSYQTLNNSVSTAAKTIDAEKIAREVADGKSVQGGVTFQPPLVNMPTPSSRFGPREAPLPGASTFHGGIDLPAPAGTPIYASADGTVENAWNDMRKGGGNSVVLSHANGMQTGYAHMQQFTVKPGQQVKKGEIIGYVGSTGRSTGPHLHYTVTGPDGKKIDPEKIQFGVAMGDGKIIEGPQDYKSKLAAISAIEDPELRKMAQAEFDRITRQTEMLKKQQAEENLNTAMNIAYSGDGNQWRKVAVEMPALWNSLDPKDQALLMKGRPKGDDPETMLTLLKDPNKWQASELQKYRPYISEETYQRFYAQGNGPKAADTVRAATYDNDMLNATLIKNGLDDLVNVPANDKSKQIEVINLRERFKVMIDAEQTVRKRELTRDEKQGILDTILMDKAQVPNWIFGSTEIPVFQLGADDAKTAYVVVKGEEVKLSSIPAEQRAIIVNKLNERGLRVTEAAIASLWVEAGKPK